MKILTGLLSWIPVLWITTMATATYSQTVTDIPPDYKRKLFHTGKENFFDVPTSFRTGLKLNRFKRPASAPSSYAVKLTEDKPSTTPLSNEFISVRLRYNVEAFPKIRYLMGEYRMLTKSLHSLYDIIEMTVTTDFTNKLKEQFHQPSSRQSSTGIISAPTEQIFACKDVFSNPDIEDVYINLICTPENVEMLKGLVSPKCQPKDKGNVHTMSGLQDYSSENSCLRSSLFIPPEICICWIPNDIHSITRLSEVFDKFDRRIHDRIFFVTDSDNIIELKKELQRVLYNLDERQNNEIPVVCTATLENVRKNATFTLSDYIFGRLTVLKQILEKSQKYIRNMENNQKDMCIHCLSTTFINTAILDQQDASEHGDTEMSDQDKKFQQLCKLLEEKILHVDSLLNENPRKEEKIVYKDISEDKVKKLLGLKEQGVKAFGVWSDEFRVYINSEQQTEYTIKETETEIRKIIADEFERINIIRCKGQMIVKYVEKGDELFKDHENFGTLGIFARDSTDDLLALTSEHVIPKEQTAYVDIDGQLKELGSCHKTTAHDGTPCHDSDFSLIKINQDMDSRCITEFKSDTGEVLEPHLFTGQNAELHRRIVHKKGATTNWTTGIIRSFVKFQGDPFIVVKGRGCRFAKEGDSGSVVFTYDKSDYENTKIYLVSMVVGHFVDSKKNIMTSRMDKTLDKLSPNTLKFDHLNQHNQALSKTNFEKHCEIV